MDSYYMEKLNNTGKIETHAKVNSRNSKLTSRKQQTYQTSVTISDPKYNIFKTAPAEPPRSTKSTSKTNMNLDLPFLRRLSTTENEPKHSLTNGRAKKHLTPTATAM